MKHYKEYLRYQEDLATKFNYKNLPARERKQAIEHYIRNIPTWLAECDDCGIPIYTREGTLISKTYNCVKIGDYGSFLEINPEDVCCTTVIKSGQEFRIKDPKYSNNVKYHWYTIDDGSDIKMYYQVRRVTYADYVPNKWYVSVYEIIPYKHEPQTGNNRHLCSVTSLLC